MSDSRHHAHKPNIFVTLFLILCISVPTALVFGWLGAGLFGQSGFAFSFHADRGDNDSGLNEAYEKQWKTFNWHPALMVVSYTLLFGLAALSFKRFPVNHQIAKYVHFGLQTLAVALSSIAIWAVYGLKIYDYEGEQGNLYTIHGWVGWIAYCLYCFQYLLGLFSFVLPPPYPPVAWRKVIHPFHICLGVLLLFVTSAAIVSGLVDRMWIIACYDYAEETTDFGIGWMMASSVGVGVLIFLIAVGSQHVGKKGGFQLEEHAIGHTGHIQEKPVDGHDMDDVLPLINDAEDVAEAYVDDFLDYGENVDSD